MLKGNYSAGTVEAGLDEAGRGCLAGPVIAAAVILPVGYSNAGLNDSKQLSVRQRDKLRKEVEQEAVAFAVAACTPAEIDEINILNASFLAMHRAVDKLAVKPELLLVDGNRFRPYPLIRHQCIIKGDATYMSIAAASVLAKTYRDEIMRELAGKFPVYAWESNKGYPSAAHRKAIHEHGSCEHHRMSFRLYQQLKLAL